DTLEAGDCESWGLSSLLSLLRVEEASAGEGQVSPLVVQGPLARACSKAERATVSSCSPSSTACVAQSTTESQVETTTGFGVARAVVGGVAGSESCSLSRSTSPPVVSHTVLL
ncbi:unnamed protein product, partial [Ectocarpus sp. 8 AP-2014]